MRVCKEPAERLSIKRTLKKFIKSYIVDFLRVFRMSTTIAFFMPLARDKKAIVKVKRLLNIMKVVIQY